MNPSSLIAFGTTVGMVISSIKYLGENNVDQNIITKIRKKNSAKDFKTLYDLMNQMPG